MENELLDEEMELFQEGIISLKLRTKQIDRLEPLIIGVGFLFVLYLLNMIRLDILGGTLDFTKEVLLLLILVIQFSNLVYTLKWRKISKRIDHNIEKESPENGLMVLLTGVIFFQGVGEFAVGGLLMLSQIYLSGFFLLSTGMVHLYYLWATVTQGHKMVNCIAELNTNEE